MNRRTLLQTPLKTIQSALAEGEIPKEKKGDSTPISMYANKALPDTARSRAGLETYNGPWEFEQAAHLLKRTIFGPKKEEIEEVVRDGLEATLDKLLADTPEPEPPINYYFENDEEVPVGSTWVDANYKNGVNGYRRRSFRAWWVGLMINQGISLKEKMTLFWLNHFVVENQAVSDLRFIYKYNKMLRSHALGNFQRLTEEVTVSPAMLRYLNGNQNTRTKPNENYGRELLELFTIGKGPIIGEGNYTNYTEEDVREASKVLTGFRDRGHNGAAENYRTQYRQNQHDTSRKQFSAAFDHTVIVNNNENEYKDLISMIFAQKETARFIVRKFYRWFVYYVIDEAAEQNVIEPLAQLMVDNGYEVKPVLRALFSSTHFYDHVNQGCLIKNPLDFNISVVRNLPMQQPGPDDYQGQYLLWYYLAIEGEKQQMSLVNPPNVAGWSAYYQEPQFYELWINSVTLPHRTKFTNAFSNGIRRSGRVIGIDPLAFVPQVSDPMDPNVLITELAQLVFPQGITEKQLVFLKDILLPGLPDYEWPLEYGEYLTNPEDEDLENAINNKLKAVIRTMFSMAEFHLS